MTESYREELLDTFHTWDPEPTEDFYKVLVMAGDDDKTLPKEFWDLFHHLSIGDDLILGFMGYVETGVNTCEWDSYLGTNRAMRRAILDEKGLTDSERSQKRDKLYEEYGFSGFEKV